MIFPGYLIACGIALLVNLPDKKSLLLTAFYTVMVIILFQFLFWGKAQIFAWRWYLLLVLVHACTIKMAHISEVGVSKPIIILSACVIIFNLAFLTVHPSRQLFFIGMNAFQTLQLGSFIVFAPLWPFLRGVWRKRTKTKEQPWANRAVLQR